MLENGKNVLGSIIQLHVAVGEFVVNAHQVSISIHFKNGIYIRSGYIY